MSGSVAEGRKPAALAVIGTSGPHRSRTRTPGRSRRPPGPARHGPRDTRIPDVSWGVAVGGICGCRWRLLVGSPSAGGRHGGSDHRGGRVRRPPGRGRLGCQGSAGASGCSRHRGGCAHGGLPHAAHDGADGAEARPPAPPSRRAPRRRHASGRQRRRAHARTGSCRAIHLPVAPGASDRAQVTGCHTRESSRLSHSGTCWPPCRCCAGSGRRARGRVAVRARPRAPAAAPVDRRRAPGTCRRLPGRVARQG
jgi:hypothetical protein